MDRKILHADINYCYANIECFFRPELRGKRVAVAGSTEERSGIILAATPPAKKFGVKTGNAIWEAEQCCPNLVVLKSRMPLYHEVCTRIKRQIYSDYTNQQESFGLDEQFLDITGTQRGSGLEVAEEIRHRVKKEFGVTVSVGCSFNKVFAKLGSDYQKPDAVTNITRDNYQDIVWPLPVSDLLYVGRSRTATLERYGIRTIGQLAAASPDFLYTKLGKWGLVLSSYANGRDTSPVLFDGDDLPVESISHSNTPPKDITCEEDAAIALYPLVEGVTEKLRELGFLAGGVKVYIRDVDLHGFIRQHKLSLPTSLTGEVHTAAMALLRKNWNWRKPLRSIGVVVYDLMPDHTPVQESLFVDSAKRRKLERIERTVDRCRDRYGYFSIRRGITMLDDQFGGIDANGEHKSPFGAVQVRG